MFFLFRNIVCEADWYTLVTKGFAGHRDLLCVIKTRYRWDID